MTSAPTSSAPRSTSIRKRPSSTRSPTKSRSSSEASSSTSARSTSTSTATRTRSTRPTAARSGSPPHLRRRRATRPTRQPGRRSTKNNPFTATDCNALKFKPKFSARLLGGKKATKRRAHPKLQAILQGRIRRRERGPGGVHAAEDDDPRPEQHQDDLHQGAAVGEQPARRARSTATRRRPRRCSKER